MWSPCLCSPVCVVWSQRMWSQCLWSQCLCSPVCVSCGHRVCVHQFLSCGHRACVHRCVSCGHSMCGHRIDPLSTVTDAFYSVTKHAVRCLTEATRIELRRLDTHIRIAVSRTTLLLLLLPPRASLFLG